MRRCRGNVERFACVPDVDGNRDSVQLHVGGTELGLEVVAVAAELLTDALRLSQVRVCS